MTPKSPIDHAIREATQALAEQMERELLGAWRAGYDWVHVYDDPIAGHAPGGSYTIRQYVLATDSKRPPRPDGLTYLHSYDLRDVTKAQIDAVRE